MAAEKTGVRRPRRLGPFGSVAGGSALGQLALAASLPIVSRVYTADELGVFAILLGYSQIASIVLTGRIDQVLPRLNAGRQWAAARLVLIAGTAMAPVAAITLLAIADQVYLREVVVVSALIASIGLLNTSTFTLLAQRKYRAVASLRVTNGVVTGASQVIGGLLVPEAWMLLLTYAIGNAAAAAVGVPALVRQWRSRAAGLSIVFREEKLARFGANLGMSAVLSNLGLTLPLVGVSILFGDSTAGAFWLARRLLMVPTQLVASSVSEVSYAMVAQSSVDEISRHVHTWLLRMRLPALVLVGLGLGSAPLVHFVVGPGYPNVGWLMALLTLPAISQMVATSLANILLALHMEGVRLVWNAGRLLGLVLVFSWASVSDAGFLTCMVVFAAYTVTSYSALLWLTTNGIRMKRRRA